MPPKKKCPVKGCRFDLERYRVLEQSGRFREVYGCPLHGPQNAPAKKRGSKPKTTSKATPAQTPPATEG